MLKFGFLLHSASDEIRQIAGYPVFFAASRLRSIIKPRMVLAPASSGDSNAPAGLEELRVFMTV